ncbi:MAG: hypothetical protein NTY36_05630 [Deltaproteobacteria bacterium]|nr:hypothetical protein [Deltaproteobacteria bacterium]
MSTAKGRDQHTLRLWLGLIASLWLLAGCALCTKHLFLYRETPQKMPPAETALLITDPNLAQAALPGVNFDLGGAPWAPEQPFYQTEAYRLAIEDLDGQKVYQGQCLDTTPTYAVEVRPGSRRIAGRADLLGPAGQEKFNDSVQVNLQAGKVYLIRPDWTELQNKHLVLKVEALPGTYTPEVRARLIDRRRQTTSNASLD